MRLEQHQQAIELAASRSFQRRADFRRMMAIIVYNRDVIDDASDVEAAPDSCELCQSRANQLARDVQIQCNRRSRSRVSHVVNPRRVRQLEQSEVLPLVSEDRKS